MKNIDFLATLKSWLALGVSIVILSASIFAAVQQNYRSEANDPQIQISEDVLDTIASGRPASTLIPETQPKFDMEKGLSPFVILYDKDGKVLGGTATIDGSVPSLAKGVLDYANKKDENRVTWQPKKGVRIAAIIKKFENGGDSGYVLVGRNLREVENRIMNLMKMIAAGTVLAIIASFLLKLVFKPKETNEINITEEITIIENN